MYASDITRTFPVSGKFTAPQRDLYEAVLSAQKACIKKCKVEDQASLNELHRASMLFAVTQHSQIAVKLMPGCVMLNEELRQIGFKLSIGDVERKLVSPQIELW